jgi:hypothetical protein
MSPDVNVERLTRRLWHDCSLTVCGTDTRHVIKEYQVEALMKRSNVDITPVLQLTLN